MTGDAAKSTARATTDRLAFHQQKPVPVTGFFSAAARPRLAPR